MAYTVSYSLLYCAIVDDEGITQYVYYSDGTTIIRKGVRDSIFVVDKALTPTAFAGSEGTDWECIKMVE